MKHFKLLLISGIIGVFFLGCSEEKVAKAEPVPIQAEPSGKIIKIKGEVFSTKDGKKTQLSLNSKIFPGSTLETGKDSLARVLFSDGGVIAIGKESSFALEDYFYSENEKRADINFKRGMFEAISGKIGKSNPDKFKLKAKTATMGIRGTHIVGNLKDDGEDLLACIEGAIVVEAKDISGNITTAPVKAGMQVKVDETNTEGIKPSSIDYDEILAIINSTGLKGGEKILEKALRNLNPKPKVKRKGSYFHLALGVNRKARENVRYKLISKITGVKINSRTGELKVPTQLVEDNPITVAVKVTAKDYDETKEYVIQKGDAKDWVDIKAGAGFIVALKNDGTLWAWGKNNDGQLGLGYKKFVIKPTNVFSKIPFKSFDVGENFVVAVKADGTLWTWGDNTNGKLGLDDYSTRRKPTQIGKEKNWNSVSVGESHSLALKADGSLWAWGENIGGKLGTGDSIDYTKPTKIQSDTPWEKVTAGMEHSLGIKKDGTLWAWGVNSVGQLGVTKSLALPKPHKIGSDSNWKEITTYASSSYGIKEDGTLWSWGDNKYGILGHGDTKKVSKPKMIQSKNNWDKIVVGGSSAVGIDKDGNFWGWGANKFKEISANKGRVVKSPTKLAGNYKNTVAVGDGFIIGIGKDTTLQYKGDPKNNSLSSESIDIQTSAD